MTVNRRLKMGIGAAGIALAVALAPAVPAWAGSHETHHKSKSSAKPAAAGATACPLVASLAAAAGTTYTGSSSQPGAEKGWLLCTYKSGGSVALRVSLYTVGASLKLISANVPAHTTKITGLGNAAAHYGSEVYVQRNSAPSFSVIDETGSLSLAQTKAVAKAIVGS
jgi:hypothetical protein